MKHIILFGICLIGSFFLFSNHIEAVEPLYFDYDIIYNTFKDNDYNYRLNASIDINLKNQLEELVEVLEDSGMYYQIYFTSILTENNSSGVMKYFGITIRELDSDHVDLVLKNEMGDDATLVSKTSMQRTTITLSISGSYTKEDYETNCWNDLFNYINENKHLPTSKLGLWTSSKTTGLIYYGKSGFKSNTSTIVDTGSLTYASNISFKFLEDKHSKYDGFHLNDNIYKENAMLPTYLNLAGYGKKYYTFHEQVSLTNNSQIRFTFEVPNDKAFTFFLNDSVSYKASQIDLGTMLFGAPYLEVHRGSDIERLPLDNKCLNTRYELIYCQTEMNPFIAGVDKLELVVDLEGIEELSGGSVTVFFESEHPFSYYYSESFYKEVDWTNNYGVLLIPKVYNLSSLVSNNVYSSVFVKGKRLNLQIFEDTDLTKAPLYNNFITDTSDRWFQYKKLFPKDHLNQTIFVLNKNYLVDPNKTKIRYDTRYFVHSLCKNSSSCDVIQNSNTGEDITIIPPIVNEEETGSSDNGLFSMFHFFEKPIKFLFDGVGTLYYDYVPPIVQKYWYFALGFTVFILILRLFF